MRQIMSKTGHILIWKGTQHKTVDRVTLAVVFSDLKKAFDTVDHQLFLTKFSILYRNSGPSLICSYVS